MKFKIDLFPSLQIVKAMHDQTGGKVKQVKHKSLQTLTQTQINKRAEKLGMPTTVRVGTTASEYFAKRTNATTKTRHMPFVKIGK